MKHTYGVCESCQQTEVLATLDDRQICLACISESAQFINASWETRQGIMVFFADARKEYDRLLGMRLWLARCFGPARIMALDRAAEALGKNNPKVKQAGTDLVPYMPPWRAERSQDGQKGT